MTWSTNNDPTNPFSARNMTGQYLTSQVLKNEHSRIDGLNRADPTRSSGSSSSSNESNIKSSKTASYKFTPFTPGNGSTQSSLESSTTSSGNSGNSSLSGRVSNNTKKDCSLL